MSLPSKVNKENFRLLDLSSDEQSEDLQLEIIPSRKKKITRRERSRGPTKPVEPSLGSEVRCAVHWALRGTLVLWLLMLTWICATLYDQVLEMRVDIVKVSSTSGSVEDALQVCHTASRVLQANASELSVRLTKLQLEHKELVEKVEKTASELAAVSGQLAAAPKLADTPRRIAELQRTVGDFGSQITDFTSTLATTRKQVVAAASGLDEVKKLVETLDARSNETLANVTASGKREDELKLELAALNSTLSARVDALQTRIEKPAPAAAPAPPPPPPPAGPPALSSTTTTTPAGSAKPSVLGIGQ